MKSWQVFPTIGVVTLATMTRHSQAQTVATISPQTLPAIKQPQNNAGKAYRWVKVHNVPATLMAWWLDAEHQTEPRMTQQSRANLAMTRDSFVAPLAPANKNVETSVKPLIHERPVVPALPAGVESMIAVEAQNALLVLSDDEGARNLQNIVEFLDKPLRQVEIEAQYVQIGEEDAQNLAIGLTGQNPAFTPQNSAAQKEVADAPRLSFVRTNFAATLQKLVDENKAKILSTSRVTAINNLTARLNASIAQPVAIAVKNATGDAKNLPELTRELETKLFVTAQFGFVVTPTINNDDTLTLATQFSKTWRLTSQDATQAIPLRTEQNLQTVANVRDGDTIAFAGFTPFEKLDPRLKNDTKPTSDNLLILLTARIVRRAQNKITPAT